MESTKTPPVKKGDKIVLNIVSIGSKGDGVAKCMGYVIIVPQTVKDSTYEVEITSITPSCGFGKVLRQL